MSHETTAAPPEEPLEESFVYPIGRIVEDLNNQGEITFHTDDVRLKKYLDAPWLRAFARERLGLNPSPRSPAKTPQESRNALPSGNDAEADIEAGEEQMKRHCALFGASGSGKTRLAFHLLQGQMRRGCSIVAIDPKPDTIEDLLALARASGIPPDQIVLLQAGDDETSVVPGWNPLDYRAAGLPISQVAGDLVSILAQGASSWGPRLQEVLINALTVIAGAGLSLLEVVRFLQSDAYRTGLLSLIEAKGYDDLAWADQIAYREAVEYFVQQFGSWGKSEQVKATAPVLNKLSELLRVPFLRTMLCAPRNQVDLAELWQTQRVILVHLDRSTLGDEGVKLLGGIVTWQLYRIAMRVEGPVPVVLSLDEMGVAEQFIGKAVAEILAIARSRKLRLLVACQHLEQLSENLRAALLGNTAVRAFFRLGKDDAREVAAALAVGTGDTVESIEVELDRRGLVALSEHRIHDSWGRAMALSPIAWSVARDARPGNSRPLGMGRLDVVRAIVALGGAERIYVRSPDTGEFVDAETYVSDLPFHVPTTSDIDHAARFGVKALCPLESRRDPREPPKTLPTPGYYLSGPAPLSLIVRFPLLVVRVREKRGESQRQQLWARRLSDLPVQHAVVWLSSTTPVLVKVVPVPDGDRESALSFAEEIRRAMASAWSGGEHLGPREIETRRRERIEAVMNRTAKSAAPSWDSGDPEPRKPEARKEADGGRTAKARRPAKEKEVDEVERTAGPETTETPDSEDDGSLW